MQIMRKYFKYLALILLAITVLSCKKGFLEESSQDLVRPTTTAALNQLMTGEAYPITNVIQDYLDLLTDDIQANYYNENNVLTALSKYAPAFTWQRNMIDKLIENAANNVNVWYNYYGKIKGCNVVLDYVDQVDGTQAEKDNLRGQALALRSYYYFMMVNLFGKPYTGSTVNPQTDLGVPLILSAEVSDAAVPRSTVSGVYTQIEQDLLKAIPLLAQNGASNTIYKFNATSAKFLLSRVYLYMGNWDACIKYADETLQQKSVLQQYNSITTSTFPISYAVTSPEVIWGYGFAAELANMPIGNPNGAVARAAFSISDNLLSMYDASDLRATYSFRSSLYITTVLVNYKSGSAKYLTTNQSISNGKAFRTAELYLNRAEAYVQKAINGDQSGVAKALADLNLLRSNRIKTANYVPLSITDPQELYAFYKAERRRELCLEDSRWFDLRRWGMPSMTHTIQLTAGSPQEVTLSPNDSRYTFDVPSEALNRNPNLVLNP